MHPPNEKSLSALGVQLLRWGFEEKRVVSNKQLAALKLRAFIFPKVPNWVVIISSHRNNLENVLEFELLILRIKLPICGGEMVWSHRKITPEDGKLYSMKELLKEVTSIAAAIFEEAEFGSEKIVCTHESTRPEINKLAKLWQLQTKPS